MLCVQLVACKPSVPDRYISPSKLESILYDFHIADAYTIIDANNSVDIDIRRKAMRTAVLKKHNISQADFDKSMEYYYRHSDRLQAVYNNLSKRIAQNTEGASEWNVSQYTDVNGDTLNIWSLSNNEILYPFSIHNLKSFTFNTDTTHHKGDSYVINFHTHYILQDGSRDATLLMAVKMDNDSIVTNYQRVNTDTDYQIQINLPHDRFAKQIKGFMYMGKTTGNDNNTTLKVLSISNISLFRIHKPQIMDNNLQTLEQKDVSNSQ